MRKLLLSLFIASSSVISAQNVQLHYDTGHTLYDNLNGRPNVTTTVEMFKPDRWGSTYMFTDIDYYNDGAAGAYWEISRELTFTKNRQWAFHAEYNGGLTSIEDLNICSRFQHAALVGAAWNWASRDYKRTFSVQLMYKQYFKGMSRKAFSSFQLTSVWGTTFANGLCTFSGFTDLWYDKDVNGKLIFLSEPQFWFNLNTIKGLKDINLSLGSEVELSNNFVFDNKGQNNRFYAIPTLAAKWTF